MDYDLLLAFFSGIIVLIVLILKLKIPAFLSLLITSILTGILAGLDANEIIKVVKNGMGGTLGFVATVVGLGAIFGGILEKTGGAKTIANKLLSITGEEKAPLALMLSGFLIAIPVFFDVGFIILFPMILALHHKTKKSILHYAIPLLAGLAVTHAFIPPTPGPIAVAEIIGANLGWVILIGVITGIPTAYISGILYGKYIGNKIDIQLQTSKIEDTQDEVNINFLTVLWIVTLPILLIILGTLVSEHIISIKNEEIENSILLLGHPFTALIVANILAWYILGRNKGLTTQQLTEVSTKSLQPAGIIILVTGAGGVYKQVLVDTGAGKMIAEGMQEAGLSIILFSFLAATVIRVLQGSATVAMITAAGLVAPLLTSYTLSPIELAAIVISIASGSTMMSHFNDSGFWLVKEYLKLDENQALITWTSASTILGLTGFLLACIAFWVG